MKKQVCAIFSILTTILTVSCNNSNEIVENHSHPEVLREDGDFPLIKDEYKDKITFKVMGACNAAINTDWENNKFFIRMEELTGVHMNFEVYGDGMYKEKKNLMLSTGNNLPDIFFKASLNNYDEVSYGGKSIRQLDDLIENYAPNIKKILAENPVVKKSITTSDGHIYALPTIYLNLPNNTTTNMRGFFWINQKWLDDLSLSMPKTPDDLLNVLRQFKKTKCTIDDSYPLVIAGIDDLLKMFNFFGMDLVSYWVQGNEEGTLEFSPQTDNFKKALNFIRQLVSEGLMNKSWSSTTPTQINALGPMGDYYGCFVSSAPQYVVGFEKMRQYTTLNPLSESGKDGFWGASYPVQRGCFAITTKCQYPELAIRYIDTLYDITKPYGLWSAIGKENVEWKWIDESKTAWKSTISDQQYSEIMATTIVQTGDGMPYAVDESFWSKQQTETDLYTRPLRNEQMKYGKVGYPLVYFDKNQLREISDLAADINSYINRYMASVISGEKNLDDDFDTFKKFNRLQLDRYLGILKNRYDDFNNAIKGN